MEVEEDIVGISYQTTVGEDGKLRILSAYCNEK
jgi:hypothetical protein